MHLSSLPQFSRSVRRFAEVVTVLTKFGLADWLSHSGFERPKNIFVDKDGVILSRESHAARIRLAMTELGITSIKLGQMLSTRPDLVGAEVAAELSKLQQSVPPDPAATSIATIEAELHRPIGELFSEFDPVPIGSASIGQVHRARLPDGREVVVKVRHPGIEALVRDDLAILHELAKLAGNSAEMKRYQPAAVVREFHRSLTHELDFGREERNLHQFAASFADDATVHFPAAFPEWCTSRVLTMEYVSGYKLDEAALIDTVGVSRDELARRGATVWLEMVFRDGFFHADPHPGNLVIMPGGVIGILDCGMVGRVDESLRETIEEGLAAIAQRDGRNLSRLIMHLCSAPPDFDEAGFLADLTDYVSFYGNQPIERLKIGAALREMVEIISRYQLVLPSTVSNLVKTFAMLEGTARVISPNVNVLELIKAYHTRTSARRLAPAAQWRRLRRVLGEWRHVAEILPGRLSDVFDQVQSGRFDIHLEHRRLEPSVNKLAMGMITSALFLGSALLWSNRVPPVVYGFSACGVLGCAVSVALGCRLLTKIWRE